jgi:hypothetical protein
MGLLAQIQNAFKTSPQNVPGVAKLLLTERGKVGKPNALMFRNWAEHSPWIRAAINVRKAQVSMAEWDIVPFDRTLPFNAGAQQQLKELFERPSQMVESFRSFIEPVIEDALVLDAGVIEKERTLGGKLFALHAVDGAKVKVNALWDGDPGDTRYYWVPTPLFEVPFLNDDMVYMMTNPRTYSVVGLANLETLKMTIDAEIDGAQYNARQVKNAAPDGLLHLGEGIREERVEAFRLFWDAEIAGRGALAITGGGKNPSFIPFRASNRDMQYTEWLEYLVRQICAVFLISPQDLGITFDVNRATGEVQQELTEDRGLRPLLALLQDYLTREIVWDRSYGGPDNNLAFRYKGLNLKESKARAEINKLALAGVPWKRVNEARLDEGRDPIGDLDDEANPANQLLANTPLGIVKLDEVMSAEEAAKKPEPAAGKPEGGDAPKAPSKPTGPKAKPS